MVKQHILPPQRQRLEIAMDVLKGCAYSCMGCMVDKELHASESLVPDVTLLADEFIDNGFFPFDFTVGATDLGTALNRDSVCNNVGLQMLVRKFQTLSFTCAMLDKKPEYYINLANNVRKLTNDECFVRFIVPISDKYADNLILMDNIRKRVEFMNELLVGMVHEVTFIINVTAEFMDRISHEQLAKIYNWPDFNMMTDIVYNIPYGRASDISTNIKYREDVPHTSRALAAYYEWLDGDTEHLMDPDLDGITGTHVNIGVLGDNYYVIPYLKDEFNIFTERFRVKEPTFDSVMEKVIEMKDPDNFVKIPECDSCEHTGFCTEKGIHMIMEDLNIDRCPVRHDI